MSYCTELKKDLCAVRELTKAQKTAMLYGMFYAGREHEGRRVIQSESADIVDAARALCAEVFPGAKHDTVRLVRCGSSLFTFGFKSGERAPAELFGDYSEINSAVSGEDSVSGAFLRGVFLSCGFITDPAKGYHLELSLSDETRAEQLHRFIEEHGIGFRTSVRARRRADGSGAGELVVYAKKSEVIEDFLTYIGAEMRAMEIMQIKIEKSVTNRVNRMLNCDSANLDKTIAAADRLCADIRLVLDTVGESGLKPALLAAARVRLENPESSLSELCEMFDPPMSRSGLNHRLKKLSEMAEEIRQDSPTGENFTESD